MVTVTSALTALSQIPKESTATYVPPFTKATVPDKILPIAAPAPLLKYQYADGNKSATVGLSNAQNS